MSVFYADTESTVKQRDMFAVWAECDKKRFSTKKIIDSISFFELSPLAAHRNKLIHKLMAVLSWKYVMNHSKD